MTLQAKKISRKKALMPFVICCARAGACPEPFDCVAICNSTVWAVHGSAFCGYAIGAGVSFIDGIT